MSQQRETGESTSRGNSNNAEIQPAERESPLMNLIPFDPTTPPRTLLPTSVNIIRGEGLFALMTTERIIRGISGSNAEIQPAERESPLMNLNPFEPTTPPRTLLPTSVNITRGEGLFALMTTERIRRGISGSNAEIQPAERESPLMNLNPFEPTTPPRTLLFTSVNITRGEGLFALMTTEQRRIGLSGRYFLPRINSGDGLSTLYASLLPELNDIDNSFGDGSHRVNIRRFVPIVTDEISEGTRTQWKEKLSTFSTNSSGFIDECGLCYEKYSTDKDFVLFLECIHIFCESCIAYWFGPDSSAPYFRNTCPFCRTTITEVVKGSSMHTILKSPDGEKIIEKCPKSENNSQNDDNDDNDEFVESSDIDDRATADEGNLQNCNESPGKIVEKNKDV